MKVLFLSQGRRISDHSGWEWSLDRLQSEGFIDGYMNLPWIGYGEEYGFDALYRHVVKLVKTERFDVVYFHYFHNGGRPSPEQCIRELKSMEHAPVVMASCGDSFNNDWRPPYFPVEFQGASRAADLTFATQMGNGAKMMLRWGAKRIILTPNSLCPIRFGAHSINPQIHKFDFDVVMIGSHNGGGINPFNAFYWRARERERLVYKLSERFGVRFGLFGRGWGNLVGAQGPCAFDTQQQTMQRGRVVVGGNPYTDSDYYSSNRLFFEVASGVPTVELRVNRLDKILRDGNQVYFADDIDGVVATVERLLNEDPIALYQKAATAAKEMVERHTQYHRMKFKLSCAKAFIRDGARFIPPFDFFLSDVDVVEESKYAYMRGGK